MENKIIKTLEGIIYDDGSILGIDGNEYYFDIKGFSEEGFAIIEIYIGEIFPEDGILKKPVLQLLNQYIGRKVKFDVGKFNYTYNHRIVDFMEDTLEN